MKWEWRTATTLGSLGLYVDGRWAGTAYPGGSWYTSSNPSATGRADPPTLDAAQAALLAEVWAQAAERLGGR